MVKLNIHKEDLRIQLCSTAEELCTCVLCTHVDNIYIFQHVRTRPVRVQFKGIVLFESDRF